MKQVCSPLAAKQTVSPIASMPILIVLFSALLTISCTKNNENVNAVAEQVEVNTEELIPDTFFQRSLEAFAKQDYSTSAKAIREAAAAMNELSTLASEDQQTAIENSVKELSDLAESVAVDRVDGIQDLNYFFSRAGKALAGLHARNVKSYHYQLNGKQAGVELIKVVDQVENLLKYQQHKLTKEEETFLEETKTFALNMQKGGKMTDAEVEGLLKSVSDHLDKWDSEINITYSSHKQEEIVPTPKK